METLLVFLAIVIIQLVAAKLQQKKKAARRAEQQQPARSEVPGESAPMPDPFRELREMLGMPEQEQQEQQYEELPPEPEQVKSATVKDNEEFTPAAASVAKVFPEHPFVSITSRKAEAEPRSQAQVEEQTVYQRAEAPKVGNGFVWAAILQEPRFRKKWATRC